MVAEVMTETVNLPLALDELAAWMERAKEDKAEIDKIHLEAANEMAAYVARLDDANIAIRELRQKIDAAMTEQGIRTTEGAGLQVQRPKSTKLTITNLDTACAHLADIGRIQEVQRVVIDEKAVLAIAQDMALAGATNGIDNTLDGVEQVTTYGFKVVPQKGK